MVTFRRDVIGKGLNFTAYIGKTAKTKLLIMKGFCSINEQSKKKCRSLIRTALFLLRKLKIFKSICQTHIKMFNNSILVEVLTNEDEFFHSVSIFFIPVTT